MIKTYRKKSIDVKAIQWTGDNLKEIIDFTGLHESAKKWTWEEYASIVEMEGFKIFTREGSLVLSIGDFIVQGYTEHVGNHYWPVKPDYFEKAYFEITDYSTIK